MEDLREAKRTCSRLGIGYVAFLVLGLLLQVEIVLVLQFFAEIGYAVQWGSWLMVLSSLLMYLIGIPVCWLIIRDMPMPCRPWKKKFTAGQMIVAFFICMAVMYLGNIIGVVLMGIVGAFFGEPMLNPVNELIENMNPWMIFLLTVVLAPLCEEFLYRKLLIDRVGQYGDKVAILLSGVLFGLSHGNFYQFFYAFGLGVIFAYIYVNTGRLRYTIGLHAAINFIGSIVALHVTDNIWFTGAYLIFLLGSIVLGIVFLIIYRHEIRFKPAMVIIPAGRYFEALFLNLGMILFLGVSIFLFFLT